MVKNNEVRSRSMTETAQTNGSGPAIAAGPRLIVSVVDRGNADESVRAAIRAGAQATTLFVGRGAEAEQQIGASGLAVRSEKEVIVTVVGAEIADAVVQAMAGAIAPGHRGGYVAKMPVARVVGLLEAVAMAIEGKEAWQH
jgi:hypothetical protein